MWLYSAESLAWTGTSKMTFILRSLFPHVLSLFGSVACVSLQQGNWLLREQKQKLLDWGLLLAQCPFSHNQLVKTKCGISQIQREGKQTPCLCRYRYERE